MRPLNGLLAGCALAVGLISAGGCASEQVQREQLIQELEQTRQAVGELTQRNEDLQAETAAQRRQISSLQALGEKRLEKLFHVRRIELGRYTGGVNLNDAKGDDGVKVYLKTIDQDGSAIKAAGDVKIQLFDLAAESKDNLIGQYRWNVEQMSKQWFGGFMTYHFSFECLWDADKGPPERDEITVRVEFTDYLTGKVFTAQKLCKVKPPARQAPGSQPVE